jgi:uncharacterized membrane protein
MNSKKYLGAMMFLIALLTVSLVSALPVTIDVVEMDDVDLDPSSTNFIGAFERDGTFDVRVELTATAEVNDAQIEVYIRGYDHDDRVEDISKVFDMKEGRTYYEDFSLTLPYRLEKDLYKLRVRVESRDGNSTQETFEIEVEAEEHSMKIKDVVFSPSNAVVAGRSLLTSVRIKSVGMETTEEGVKVGISIPALGLSAVDYIDEVDEDDSVTSEELYLRIPACTKPGTYDSIVTVTYHDGDYQETRNEKITVIQGDLCELNKDPVVPVQPKTIITVGPTSQDVIQGQGGVIYPLTLSNAGSDARTYVIAVDGYADWADVSVSPANIVVLQSGEAKALYVYVSANEDAPVGEHMFSLTVTSGAETLKEFVLKSNVVAGEAEPVTTNWGGVKKVLEIGLVVLVVLLVILGLIIGFSRLKGSDDDFDDDDDEGKSETYY